MSPAPSIYSAVATDQPVIWAASRVEINRASATEISIVRRRLKTPEQVWSVTLDVTDAVPALVAGDWRAIVVCDWYFLLKTQAERLGDAGIDHHRLRHISSDGRVLWSLPWQTADQVGLLGDRLVVVRFLGTADEAAQPPAMAHLVDPRSGRSLMSHAISIPNDLLATYDGAPGSALRLSLEQAGPGYAVRVDLPGSALPGHGQFVHPLPFGRQARRSMGFICPECLTPGALQITRALHLPADSRSDDITLQVVACDLCGFRAVAVYEESRRGSLNSESWEHIGYRVGRDVLDQINDAMQQCLHPDDDHCACTVHQALGRTDANGRWQRPDGVEPQGIFPMQLITKV
jgi:hypothetical protein